MSSDICSVITGTGKYIPTRRIRNDDFLQTDFYDKEGNEINKSAQEIIDKFQAITTIAERRYVTDNLVTSDIAYEAAVEAIKTAGIDQEELDYVIVAHNFGDVGAVLQQVDMVPTLAARVKYKLKIKNPYTIAYDLPFGCPGWLQALIQADYYIKSGDAKKILVIGAEVLSRVSDPHDRDSMLYADGAGATILEARNSSEGRGILAHTTRSDTYSHSRMLFMGTSYHADAAAGDNLFLKMNGRKLYQYALETVPQAIRTCLEKAGIPLQKVRKILIHQANGKMDDEILKRLYALYQIAEVPENVMPMTISWLGNSSTATVPTLLDLILKGHLEPHTLHPGDHVVFASVGAGMNINAVVYRM